MRASAEPAAPRLAEMVKAARGICPVCKQKLMAWEGHPRRPSRDHILPSCRGGRAFIHGAVFNIRMMCAGCNSFLAVCGHCPGARAAVQAVASDICEPPTVVATRWGMSVIASSVDNPALYAATMEARARKAERRAAHEARQSSPEVAIHA